jgi:hypothetical protein
MTKDLRTTSEYRLTNERIDELMSSITDLMVDLKAAMNDSKSASNDQTVLQIPLFIITTSDIDSKLLEAMQKDNFMNYGLVTLIARDDLAVLNDAGQFIINPDNTFIKSSAGYGAVWRLIFTENFAEKYL